MTKLLQNITELSAYWDSAQCVEGDFEYKKIMEIILMVLEQIGGTNVKIVNRFLN